MKSMVSFSNSILRPLLASFWMMLRVRAGAKTITKTCFEKKLRKCIIKFREYFVLIKDKLGTQYNKQVVYNATQLDLQPEIKTLYIICIPL